MQRRNVVANGAPARPVKEEQQSKAAPACRHFTLSNVKRRRPRRRQPPCAALVPRLVRWPSHRLDSGSLDTRPAVESRHESGAGRLSPTRPAPRVKAGVGQQLHGRRARGHPRGQGVDAASYGLIIGCHWQQQRDSCRGGRGFFCPGRVPRGVPGSFLFDTFRALKMANPKTANPKP